MEMITSLREMIFGFVLFYNGKPCALINYSRRQPRMDLL